MSTWPELSAPQPDQWHSLISRQVLGGSAATIVFSGIAAAYEFFTIDLRLTKDGTAAAATLSLNGGTALVDHVAENVTSAVLTSAYTTGATSVPLVYSGNTIASSRDGQWTIRIMQSPPKDAMVFVHGGYFRGTSAVPVPFDCYAKVALGSARISTITITSASGSFAASSAAVLTGERH